ncbi:MAG: thioesterase family protein [Desulfobacteraceae bacterium]|jgi:acyl-CoA thioester hydrolase|nr:thioesterase family protein [Desulfobacteraceae bacterium]
MDDLLNSYPVVIEIPIAWGDMDAFQHVNNTMYFRYFESARISYFEKLAFTEQMKKTGIGPILATTQCRFKIPLTYPDQVSVGAKVDVLENDRFLMNYLVVSHKHKNIAAIGEGMLVSFNYLENKKAPLPDDIRARITGLEKGVNPDFQAPSMGRP